MSKEECQVACLRMSNKQCRSVPLSCFNILKALSSFGRFSRISSILHDPWEIAGICLQSLLEWILLKLTTESKWLMIDWLMLSGQLNMSCGTEFADWAQKIAAPNSTVSGRPPPIPFTWKINARMVTKPLPYLSQPSIIYYLNYSNNSRLWFNLWANSGQSVRIDNWWISTYNPLPNFKILNLQIQIRPIAITRIRTVVYRLGTTGSWLWLRRHHRLFHWCSAVACAMKNSNSSVNRWAWSSKVASVFSAVTTAYLWAASTVPTDSSLIVISHTVKEPHAAMVKKYNVYFHNSMWHIFTYGAQYVSNAPNRKCWWRWRSDSLSTVEYTQLETTE